VIATVGVFLPLALAVRLRPDRFRSADAKVAVAKTQQLDVRELDSRERFLRPATALRTSEWTQRLDSPRFLAEAVGETSQHRRILPRGTRGKVIGG